MNDITGRSIYIASLGALMAGLSIATLIWAPGNRTTDLIGMLLLLTALVGIGLVIAGAKTALQAPLGRETEEAERHGPLMQ